MAAPRRFLALGDSYTVGEGTTPAGRWPERLAARLRAAGTDIGDPEIIARTGWTTDELEAAIDAAAPRGPFALATLLIGVNNQYRGRGLDEYRAQFAALLDRAIALAGGAPGRVRGPSIPDWGVSPFARQDPRGAARIAAEIDAFNAAAAAACAACGVAFVDITATTRARGAEPAMLADDGLHPSAAMHALWVEALLPPARRLLAGPRPA